MLNFICEICISSESGCDLEYKHYNCVMRRKVEDMQVLIRKIRNREDEKVIIENDRHREQRSEKCL